MADLKIGTQRPPALYYGASAVSRVYYGAIRVWPTVLSIVAGTGSYLVTGASLTLIRGKQLIAATGSYATTGTASALKRGRLVTIELGTYVLSGATAAVKKGATLITDTGNYSISGTATTLLKTWIAVAEASSYAVSGTAATMQRALPLVAAVGSYVVTGDTAALRKSWNALVGGEGTYSTTGGDADLLYAANEPLDAEGGAYATTGDDSALSRAWKLAADAGDYLISGTVALLLKPWRMTAAAGSYALTGTAATTKYGREAAAAAGSYSVAGTAATAGLTYDAPAIDFPGSDDFLSRGAGLTGAADSKIFTLSFWFKTGTALAVQRVLIGDSTSKFRANLDTRTGGSSEFFGLGANNSGGTQILGCNTSNGSVVASGSWQHVLISVDLSDTGKRHIYLDDVSDAAWGTYTNDTIDFTMANWRIGVSSDGTSNDLDAEIAELWFAIGTYIDFSVEANRRLFRTAAGKPVGLGNDGSRPTGSAPIIYLGAGKNLAGGWITNAGSGGGFTQSGTLADAASSPSD